MNSKIKQKMMLFLNEPILRNNFHKNKDQAKLFSFQNIKSIYPTQPQLERLQNLQEARERVEKDKQLDQFMLNFIIKTQGKLKQLGSQNQRINMKKKKNLKKFQIQLIDEELQKDLSHLDKEINHYQNLFTQVNSDKNQIKKMLDVTRIQEALKLQNKMLKKQRRMLQESEDEIDDKLRKRK